MNININKYFHMIPLWKSPIKLPMELPVDLGIPAGIWGSLLASGDRSTKS